MSVETRLDRMGLTLPAPARPGGAYTPTQICGPLLFIAAQFPIEDGQIRFTGRLGDGLSIDDAKAATRLAGLNVLAQIKDALGSFDRLRKLARLEGHFQTTPAFDQHATILDAASELFNEALAQKAGHVRALYGHASLPLNLPVELLAIAEIDAS